jgi:hypothetical protein
MSTIGSATPVAIAAWRRRRDLVIRRIKWRRDDVVRSVGDLPAEKSGGDLVGHVRASFS